MGSRKGKGDSYSYPCRRGVKGGVEKPLRKGEKRKRQVYDLDS